MLFSRSSTDDGSSGAWNAGTQRARRKYPKRGSPRVRYTPYTEISNDQRGYMSDRLPPQAYSNERGFSSRFYCSPCVHFSTGRIPLSIRTWESTKMREDEGSSHHRSISKKKFNTTRRRSWRKSRFRSSAILTCHGE